MLVTNNGVESGPGKAYFNYTPPLQVLAVAPSTTPSARSTDVTVTGVGFVFSSGLACHFQHTIVRARYLSPTAVVCATPPLQPPGTVVVRVSNDGEELSTSGVPLTFTAQLRVSSLSPHTGPTGGGTQLSVSGFGFSNSSSLKCRFQVGARRGTQTPAVMPVAATYVSATKLTCITPAQPVGGVVVEVSLNGQDFTADGLVFQYRPTPVVSTLRPAFGPVSGGTLVTVQGSALTNSGSLACSFGGAVVPGRWSTDASITCISPLAWHSSSRWLWR